MAKTMPDGSLYHCPAPLSLLALAIILHVFAPESAHALTPPQKEVRMSIPDAIDIALKNNVSLKNAYRDRIIQRYNLKVAEDKFTPKPTITASAQKVSTSHDGSESSFVTGEATLGISQTVPTGALLNVGLGATVVNPDYTGSTTDQKWSLTLLQPLLKGGGIDTNTASVRIARIDEKVNIINLKATVIDLVASVIDAYRNYLQARDQLNIARQSMQRAQDLVTINREMIDAGRMAEVEIVQTEADIASREFSILAAENAADSARLTLIKLLDINKHTMIIPEEKVSMEPVPLDYESSLSKALANRPDYLGAQLNLEISRINVMLAKNNKLWELALVGGAHGAYTRFPSGIADSTSYGWNLGLQLFVPLRDLSLEQAYIAATVDLERDQANLAKLRENIGVEVENALRDVDMKFRQIKLARLARTLSEKKLEIEKEKLKAGRSTNFQLLSYQNDLVDAQNNEINAGVSYQGALTALGRVLGTLLDTWGIAVGD